MALPQKISEQLARVPSRTPGISGQLLMLTSLLFFLSLASYIGLKYGYQPHLNAQVKDLDKEIDDFAKQIPPREQTEIINFHSQLTNLKILLANHTHASLFYAWFEKNTQVNTSYQNLDLNLAQGTLNLTGISKTIEDVGEQLLILNQLPEVKKVTLSGVSASPGKFWQFNLQISVDPKLIVREPRPAE